MTSRWLHSKGGTYTLLFSSAVLESNGTRYCVYQSESNGTVWLRPFDEFYDGRFVQIQEKEKDHDS